MALRKQGTLKGVKRVPHLFYHATPNDVTHTPYREGVTIVIQSVLTVQNRRHVLLSRQKQKPLSRLTHIFALYLSFPTTLSFGLSLCIHQSVANLSRVLTASTLRDAATVICVCAERKQLIAESDFSFYILFYVSQHRSV